MSCKFASCSVAFHTWSVWMCVNVCMCPEGRTWVAEGVPDVLLEVKELCQRAGPLSRLESGNGEWSSSISAEPEIHRNRKKSMNKDFGPLHFLDVFVTYMQRSLCSRGNIIGSFAWTQICLEFHDAKEASDTFLFPFLASLCLIIPRWHENRMCFPSLCHSWNRRIWLASVSHGPYQQNNTAPLLLSAFTQHVFSLRFALPICEPLFLQDQWQGQSVKS